jgi:large subunit ribosomal protein L10
MKKQEKQVIINGLLKSFDMCEAAFVVLCPTVNCSKTSILKKKLYGVGGNITIAKNSLLRLAAKENESIKLLENDFKNQISIIFAFKNVQKVAAVIKGSGYGKDILFCSGLLGKGKIDNLKFEFLASIPSEELLKAKLCWVLSSPIYNLIYTLKQVVDKNNDK